jgi:hypothetical protein
MFVFKHKNDLQMNFKTLIMTFFWNLLHKPWHNNIFKIDILKDFFEDFCENILAKLIP